MDYSDERITSGDIILTIFFLGSFFPYGHIIYTGINGIYFGLQGFVHAYGLAAMIIDAVYMTFYLLLPICLIDQIWYAVHVMKKHRILKIISLAAVGTVILGFIIVIPVSDCIVRAAAEEDPVRIREYLADKYGEEFASDVKIEASGNFDSSTISRDYYVHTDVLPAGSYFTVHNDPPHDDVYVDDLMEVFSETNDQYIREFADKLEKDLDIADNIDLEPTVNSIDFGDYRHGDDYKVLFDRTVYEIGSVRMHLDGFTRDNVFECVSSVWKEVYPKTKETKEDGLFAIYLLDKDYYCITIYIWDGSYEDGPYAEIVDSSDTDLSGMEGTRIELD